MKTLLHLVKKDLVRLWLPVVLLCSGTVGKIAFFSVIIGKFSLPDLDWINRMQSGPELFLRAFTEPFLTYLFVGWLVFEDSPVESGAHWITRPISGVHLFAAKLVGASLLFVLLPLLVNLAWWDICGFGVREVAIASGELMGQKILLVSLGLLFASLTGAYPRFILWSLVGLGAFGAFLIVFLYFGDRDSGLLGPLVSKLLAWSAGGCILALVVSCHQFATRRYRRSLVLAVVGFAGVATLGAAWTWNVTVAGREMSSGRGLGDHLALKLGDSRLGVADDAGQFAGMDLQVTGIPANRVVTQVRALGEWRIDGETVWRSNAKTEVAEFRMQQLRSLLRTDHASASMATVPLSMPLPKKLANFAVHRLAEFHAGIDLDLYSGTIVTEIPLSAQKGRVSGRGGTIWNLAVGPTTWKSQTSSGDSKKDQPARAVSVTFCEQSIGGLASLALIRPSLTYYALLNRSTGLSIFSDRVHSGPLAGATLNQVQVVCWQLFFPFEAKATNLEDWSLVVIRLGDGETVKRSLELDQVRIADSLIDRFEG